MFDGRDSLSPSGVCLMLAMLRRTVAAAVLLSGSLVAYAADDTSAALTLEGKISLGDIRGRIDHLAVDMPRHRLFVAELGNDSVGVVDLAVGKTIRTLTGLREPQGIGYVSITDTLYVANAGDGSVHVLRGSDLASVGQINLGSDADNVRISQDGSRVFVGYGDGALAIIDTKTQSKLGDIPLKAHPESFRIEAAGSRIFVNVPDAHAIAVVDSSSRQQIANWPTGELRSNYALVLEGSRHVLAVFRHPAKVGVFDVQDGRLLSSVATCGDSDDVFVDSKRRRLYVICGEGYVDVFVIGEPFRKVQRISTEAGARTGLFVPETDRLYVAARAGFARPAAIWVFKPAG
jgi:DNA-binding beta-propeller fold protein YncE